MTKPQQIATVHIEHIGTELCLYDWQRKQVHTLNQTAAAVWLRCDGQTSPDQIAQQVQALLGVAQAEELVQLSLRQLAAANLLEQPAQLLAQRQPLNRRQFLKLGVVAALLPVVSSIVAPTPVAAQSPSGSQTFDFTGAEQQFIVPLGVTSVTIQAFGAQGGTLANGVNASGDGAMVTATILVTPGETLFVYVGGQGIAASSGVPGAGGFNGGGAGGWAPTTGVGAGGGGASDVRQGGNGLNNRVVVAGGGGGGSVTNFGWDGGYPDGQSGFFPGDGQGGTQTNGGAGGAGIEGGNPGTAGTFGLGGTGGDTNLAGIGGGGGGGGYYGGGGGGADDDPSTAPDGVGGGGGSGYVIPTATNVSFDTVGNHTGNGQVIISW